MKSIIFFLFFPLWAQSYMIGDHIHLTRIAYEEFLLCENKTANDYLKHLIKGNRDEDMNLLRKWTQYSHFYHPEKQLDPKFSGVIDRYTSDHRLIDVEQKIDALVSDKPKETTKIFIELGYAIHHIQDLTSPPHVIPINHPVVSEGLHDSYEMYEKRNTLFPDDFNSSQHCSYMSLGTTLLELGKSAASKTLHKVRSSPISVYRENQQLTIYWTYFWKEAENFGTYGILGNNFGKLTIEDPQFPGKVFSIEESVYNDFMKEQYRMAIEHTKSAISIIWKKL